MNKSSVIFVCRKILTLFKSVLSILRPANVWIAAKARPETLPLMKFLARLCCSKQVDEMVQCTLCTNVYLDKLKHMTSDCSTTKYTLPELTIMQH